MSQVNLSGTDAQTTRMGDDSGGEAVPHGRHGKEKKLGHRRVTTEGTVTYKKKSTSELQAAIQIGIEHSVGRPMPQRDLLLKDFGVIDTVDFPADGTKITPAHSFSDFKFKTYAPFAFRFFRDLFDVDMSEFLRSLCLKELRELSNPGASGSIFYITQDDEFIIKTVQHKEAAFLQKLLPEYYMNLTQNKYTLLPKYYGLYCYQCGGKNIRFVVMNNLLPSCITMHEKYDLKGSTYKRWASSRERAKPNPTLKDIDFKGNHPDGLMIEEYDALKQTIERDCRVLESFRIMDYSMLLGVHNLDRAKSSDVLSEASAKEFGSSGGEEVATAAPTTSTGGSFSAGSGGGGGGGGNQNASVPTRGRSIKRIAAHTTAMEAIQGAGGATGAQSAGTEVAAAQSEDLPRLSLSKSSPGGVPAKNSRGERLLLYIGIIDILQNYRLLKKMEHTFKSVVHEADSISVHNPSFYAQRFQTFLVEVVFRKMPAPAPENARFRKIVQAAIKHGPSRKKGIARSRTNTKDDGTEFDDRPPDYSRKVSIQSNASAVSGSTDHSTSAKPPLASSGTRPPARDSLLVVEEEAGAGAAATAEKDTPADGAEQTNGEAREIVAT